LLPIATDLAMLLALPYITLRNARFNFRENAIETVCEGLVTVKELLSMKLS